MSDDLSVSVAVEGGFSAFPGLARPFTVKAGELPPAEADRLAKLVAESGFFEMPESLSRTSNGTPDSRTYTVSVQQGPQVRTLTLAEPLPNHALRELVDVVEYHRRHRA